MFNLLRFIIKLDYYVTGDLCQSHGVFSRDGRVLGRLVVDVTSFVKPHKCACNRSLTPRP